MLVAGAFVMRKLQVAPKSRMAQLLMVAVLMSTVQRREVMASAKLLGGSSTYVISKFFIYC